MSRRDPEHPDHAEPRAAHHALRDHSDRLLETLVEIRRLEAEDRTMPIGSREFAETARDVKAAADKLREISERQAKIGDHTDRADVSIDDVARAGDSDSAG